uniref:Winged helix Storkhead-box1 domain-containing protein n=1 Tax=Bos mutus grunniens TaxID=30521 RepID=A0A8B9YBT7_BOSMU
MKKTRSTTLRRAWPSSDFSDRASDRMRSRSEKDYRLHKRFPAAFAPQASRGYMTSGVPTPSQEILRHTLNTLVRERKIYPTPDGYFIVTPQTYFITPSLIRTNSKWYHLDERIPDRSQCTSPQPGTITPSASGCVRERTLPRNHCDSCHCCREDVHAVHAPPCRGSPPRTAKTLIESLFCKLTRY